MKICYGQGTANTIKYPSHAPQTNSVLRVQNKSVPSQQELLQHESTFSHKPHSANHLVCWYIFNKNLVSIICGILIPQLVILSPSNDAPKALGQPVVSRL